MEDLISQKICKSLFKEDSDNLFLPKNIRDRKHIHKEILEVLHQDITDNHNPSQHINNKQVWLITIWFIIENVQHVEIYLKTAHVVMITFQIFLNL